MKSAVLALLALTCAIALGDDYRPARQRVSIQPAEKKAEPQEEKPVPPPEPEVKVLETVTVEEEHSEQPPVDSRGRVPFHSGNDAAPPSAVETPAVAAQKPAVDNRPVVRVHTVIHPKYPAVILCEPCRKFKVWHATYHDVFPIRFEVIEYPNFNALPTLIYRNNAAPPCFEGKYPDGKTTWLLSGWSGPESFLASFAKACPGVLKPKSAMLAAPVSGNSLTDMFTKFAGPGKFSFQPDKPVKAYVDENTIVEYSKIVGTTKLVSGQPAITLSEPLPVIHRWVGGKMFGIWVNLQLYGSDTNLNANPPTATLRTSRGKYQVDLKVKEVK